MDFGNLLNFLNRNQKRLLLSLLLTLPIAYVYLYRFGENVDTNMIDFALTFCIAMLFIAFNYMTMIAGMIVQRKILPYSFSQMVVPQLLSTCIAMMFDQPFITAITTFALFVFLSVVCNTFSSLLLICLYEHISGKYIKPTKKDNTKKHDKNKT